MTIQSIRKRDGRIVDFDPRRIERAIMKAFEATNQPNGILYIPDIVQQVVAELEHQYGRERIPSVEEVQDVVERCIAEAGFFEVAKSYILYRKQREEERRKARLVMMDRSREGTLMVKRSDGSEVPFEADILSSWMYRVLCGLEGEVDIPSVVRQVSNYLFNGISVSEIHRAVMLILRARIDRDIAYSRSAARVLLNILYRDVLGVYSFDTDFATIYRQGFIKAVDRGIQGGRYHPELASFDLERLANALCPERDNEFQYLGIQTLYDRYLMRDDQQNHIEVPQYFWMRVAMGLALAEKPNERTHHALRFYEYMSTFRYIPSTPTLFHSGTLHSQLSSCYIMTVEDDLEHIFKSFGDVAQLAKWSGGIGIDWTDVRATGAHIKTTNVHSQGVVPFLKILDATTAAINRSGKRRGATAAYLEVWHYDIEDFLELRKNTGDERRRTHDTNTAVWVPDLFMKRVEADAEWTLFSPDETPDLHHTYGQSFEEKYRYYERMADDGSIRLYRRIPARKLWRKMLTMLYETGHPWITFKDPCNIRSPQDHVGIIHSSNLCTEITLNTSKDEVAVCNLGSINLARHTTGDDINWEKVKDTVRMAIRMLDNVIDLNFYPIPEARRSNLRHRPVGLGMMGFQDLLFHLRIPFDTTEAVDLSDRLMEFISYHAIEASSDLAAERGSYLSFQGSKWHRGLLPIDTLDLLEQQRGVKIDVPRTYRMDWEALRQKIRRQGMRNSNTMAIAPTATISNISGCFPAAEPIYKNIYVKSNASGEFIVINHYLVEELKSRDLWNDEIRELIKYRDGNIQGMGQLPVGIRELYKTAFDIDARWIVYHAARRSKWIDQSQSINIFTATTSGKTLSEIYTTAWKMGLKTTYYLRTLGASAIEKATVDVIHHQHLPRITTGSVGAAVQGQGTTCDPDDLACESCQ